MNLTAVFFAEAGNTLKPSSTGFRTSHEPRHRSTSGECLILWADSGRWWCSSCHQGGPDAASALVNLSGCSLAEAEAEVERRGGTQEAGRKKESHVTTLLKIADTARLLKTCEDEHFASVVVDNRQELLGIGERGSGFRRWLVRQFRHERNALPSATAVAQVMEASAAEAYFDGELCEVHTRLAVHEDCIYYDLGDAGRAAVRISADGWHVIPSTEVPVFFRRPRGMQALPHPDPAGTIDDFYRLLPAMDEPSRMLVSGWLIGTFMPDGAYPILAVHGEQGSAKSTLTRQLRTLVDPNKAAARSSPKDETALILSALNGSVVALENLSHIPDWLSDALCCLSTGSGFSARKLYSDNEEMIFSVKRPTIMNGISELATRGDLVDRCLFVTLPTIPEPRRKHETAVWKHFHRHHAKALGGVLTAVSTALRRRESLHFKALPRMADFSLWCEAAAPTLGWKQGAFLTAYRENRQAATSITLDASTVASTLLDYLGGSKVEAMLMSELLRDLTNHLTDYGKKSVPKSWPRSPQSLRAHLQRLAPALRRQGWSITFHLHNEKGSPVSIGHCPTPADELSELADELSAEVRQENQSSSGSSSGTNSFTYKRSDKPDEPDELSLTLSVEEKEEEEETREKASATEQKESEKHRSCESSSGSSGLSGSSAVVDTSLELPDDDSLFVMHTTQSDEDIAEREALQTGRAMAFDPAAWDFPDDVHIEVGVSANVSNTEYIVTASRLQEVLPALLACPVLGVDTETTGLDPLTDRLRLLQLATPEKTLVIDAWQVPLALLAPVLSNPQTEFVGHNLKFDVKFLAAAGLPWPAQLRDTMLASQLLGASAERPPKGYYTLEQVVQRELGQVVEKTLQTSDWSGAVSSEQVLYAARDAAILLPLAATLHQQCQDAGLERVCDIEARCLPALAWLETSGVPIDADRWQERARLETNRASALEIELCTMLRQSSNGHAALLPEAINWQSSLQVQAVFQSLGHTLTSTASEVLTRLASSEPLAACLLGYREARKRQSTYGETWLKKNKHQLSGRVHGDYLQLGSRAGRMSGVSPNMQQLPRGPLYRSCIRPADGSCIVKADFSQIELRIAAVVASEQAMLNAFQGSQDLHKLTAANVLGIVLEAVTSEHRQLAKALNFGLLFGLGAPRLREHALSNYQVSLTESEAVNHRNAFFRLYPSIRRWHQDTGAALDQAGTLETRTLTGRRRLGVSRYTEALNSPVQGTGADGMKLALARLYEHRDEAPDARLIMTIHDEIVAECSVEAAEHTAAWLERHMREAMEDIVQHGVPIVVDVAVGQDWSGTPLPQAE